MARTGTRVFGAEPSFQGADDCRRGLAEQRQSRRSQLPKVHGVFVVSEDQIRQATKLAIERMKVVIECGGFRCRRVVQ
jgi:threonine dehydratase